MPLISLDKNESRYPHSPEVLSYLRQIPLDVLSDYNPSVDPLLEKLSVRYEVPIQSIFLANGGEEILKSAVLEVIRPGDQALLPEGGWAYYHKLISQAGGTVKYFPLGKNDHTYFYSISDILALLQKKRPRLLILGSPNNPTGHSVSPEDLKILLKKAEETGTFVLLDEVYIGFGASSLDYSRIQETYPNLLVIRTLSKFFGLAGLRVGFGFWGEHWKNVAKRYDRYLGFSHLSSDIALRALESFPHYQHNAQILIRERETYLKFFRSYQIAAYDSQSNFVFCTLPPYIFSQAQKPLLEEGIKIKFFDASQEPWFESCIRITVGLPEENQRVLDVFQKILKPSEG